jgi:nuclear GTP-binding protein
MGLLTDTMKQQRMNLLSTESFEDTFGPKHKRKRPKLSAGSLEDLLSNANTSAG